MEATETKMVEDEQPPSMAISLHAINRTPTPKTMRVLGKVLNQTYVILIDTGSTHCFMDEKGEPGCQPMEKDR